MTGTWALAALWLGLALAATLLSIWLRVATALSEIVIGAIAQLLIGSFVGGATLGVAEPWVTFLAGTGAIVLTFLAGAELDPRVLRDKWKEACAIGLVSFAAPFFGCTAIAYWVLGWSTSASWLAGIAMSTTSVAVVYAVMLEFGFNATDYGKTVLAACFITDLATVLALGFIFAPFTFKTLIFFASCGVAAIVFPWLTPRFFRRSRRHSNRLLAWIRATLAQETIKTHFHVSVGHPAEQIVRYAEEHAIDHFVVGHRGRTLFERWLIGSVARQLIAHAHCAVTVLR